MSDSNLNLVALTDKTLLGATFSQASYRNDGGASFVPPDGFIKVDVVLQDPQSPAALKGSESFDLYP